MRLCEVGDLTIGEVSSDLDLTETAVREWVKRAEVDAGNGPPGELTTAERTELQRKKQVTLATLPPARYPRLVECAIPMTACDDPELHYQFGVAMFMAGVAPLLMVDSGLFSVRVVPNIDPPPPSVRIWPPSVSE